ncbi:MAG: alpha-E domain-containing protein, partial [Planctomycetaceae bacterium]|nr:alpha-E domain-containing protein [Planctomycetaceae bacterium]
SELPSRAADNIFWLGRQLERAEALARLLRSTVNRLSGETRSTSDVEVPVLLRCLADQGQIEPGYAIDKMRNQMPSIDHILPTSVFDKTQSASLRSVIDELFRLGSIVRDRISLDTWRIIRRIDKGFLPDRFGVTNLADVLTMTDDLITELSAFSGIIMESMTRTQAFRFLELGRRVERSLQIISLVKNCFIPMPEAQGPIFETVLEVADSLMTYRSRYLANLQLAAVLDLLLTDETNPRSLVFQFMQLSKHVERLPRNHEQPGYTVEQRLAMTLLHSVRMLDIQEAAETHSLGDYEPLERLIETWEFQLPRLSEAISHRYLVHAVPSHQLSDISPQ